MLVGWEEGVALGKLKPDCPVGLLAVGCWFSFGLLPRFEKSDAAAAGGLPAGVVEKAKDVPDLLG